MFHHLRVMFLLCQVKMSHRLREVMYRQPVKLLV
jgi:hypothetical protein